MSDQPAAPGEHGPVLEATEARQARRGKPVLWVLIISLILVVAALFGVWANRAPSLARAERAEESGPRTFQSPEPAARQTTEPAAPADAR